MGSSHADRGEKLSEKVEYIPEPLLDLPAHASLCSWGHSRSTSCVSLPIISFSPFSVPYPCMLLWSKLRGTEGWRHPSCPQCTPSPRLAEHLAQQKKVLLCCPPTPAQQRVRLGLCLHAVWQLVFPLCAEDAPAVKHPLVKPVTTNQLSHTTGLLSQLLKWSVKNNRETLMSSYSCLY